MLVIESCIIQRLTAMAYPAEISDGTFRRIGILQRNMGPECGSNQVGIFIS